jgi:ABC-2 type transport system ATP-binding protein
VLTLTGVRKAFGSTVAVDGLSLQVRAGEVFGFLGPNGAGKTTTISIAIGLLAPDAGTVDLGGHGSPTLPAVRARIGIAPQALALYDGLSARENLEFFARLYGVPSADRRRRADELLALVGLADRAGHRVATYSGGMKRRINLAAALVHDPPLVLLDEPTAGVDPQSRNAILDIVRSLRDRGRTVVYTTHYMEEAQRLCDRVAIIDHGRLLACGTVDELIGRHGGESLVTVQHGAGLEGEPREERFHTSEPIGELTRRMAGGGVVGVKIDRPSLESVFLQLTGRSLRD